MTNYNSNVYVFDDGKVDDRHVYSLPHWDLKHHHRVPVRKLTGEYKLFVDRGLSRIFTTETVPNYVKTKIAMADAAVQGTVVKDEALLIVDMYIYKGNKNGMEEVAWKASDTMYVAVLNNKQLDELKGVYA